ncbi:hypothetical protein K466DRAFT_239884 [Polyporus arcularius HHB13444]|uniref:BTB domain-containing protein n=1 Tax=Polyporus arcularius HHB13444 TaxID=1314778 RepID=A0A5C3P2X0_9APHY|nr:hypothetical protein K466DRAFT_239884 [Polyporus arcularius HHB13444]
MGDGRDAGVDSTFDNFSDATEPFAFESEWSYWEMGQSGAVMPASNPCPPPFQPLTPPNTDRAPFPPPALRREPIDAPPGTNPGSLSVTVSTAFHLDARLLPIPPDIIVVTQDGVRFYVHSTMLLSGSTNNFNELLSPELVPQHQAGAYLSVPEDSSAFNIVLHVIYDVSCASYYPCLDTLADAVDAMAKYGITPKDHILPSKPLFALILNQAPIQPILAYCIAASHDITDMAVPVSSHTLSLQLQYLTHEVVVKIGPIYLRRLFFLHLGRLEALRRLLLPQPHLHPSTTTCDFADQKRLARAWILASGHLAWGDRPDISASAIESVLQPLANYLTCQLCKTNLMECIKQLIVRWAMVKRSI